MKTRKIFQRSGWKSVSALLLLCAATAITMQAQVFTNLANFNGSNGTNPAYEWLVQGPDGNFYGTASAGGTFNAGTVFRVTPEGNLKALYHFCTQPNCADGSSPITGLVLATDGNFYGTTPGGGANGNYGTVFKITPRGVLTTLYSFCTQPNCADGSVPTAALALGSDNNFYGTTNTGGANSHGTVFTITAAGKLTTLHSFCAQTNCADGADPFGGLVQATDGKFYGTTVNGGAGMGTVFKITPSGRLSVVHDFYWDGMGDGSADPYSTLIQASNGDFYGTTEFGAAPYGCADGCGTIFKMTPSGEVTTIVGFDGETPTPSLMQGTDGNLYGTTLDGTSIGYSTIFSVGLNGGYARLHGFDGDNSDAIGVLMQATNGTFYGTTSEGGNHKCNHYDGCGTVYSLSMGLGPFVSFVRNPAKVGYAFGILGQGLTGTIGVSLNGVPANFTVKTDSLLTARVPAGATTGFVTVTTPTGVLTSNVPFRVIQ